MTPYYQDPMVTIWNCDCREILPELSLVDLVLTDPPYGLTQNKKGGSGESSLNLNSPAGRSRVTTGGGFMGQKWDALVPDVEYWKVILNAGKPGAFLFAFGGTRTFHRLTCAIEDAGFEIRDCMMWLYGSGFPKSLDVSKAIDKAAGADREIIGVMGYTVPDIRGNSSNGRGISGPENKNKGRLGANFGENPNTAGRKRNRGKIAGTQGLYQHETENRVGYLTAPSTDEAKHWQGWGTALKPAWEPIIIARKPIEGTVAANVQKWGTGALNIDGCRIGAEARAWKGMSKKQPTTCGTFRDDNWMPKEIQNMAHGRWPSNLILNEESAAMLDDQSGNRPSGSYSGERSSHKTRGIYGNFGGTKIENPHAGSQGGASRFFYTAKASGSDRGNKDFAELPLLGIEASEFRNSHPTVKPTELMKYLIKLASREGQTILDPFAGSCTTAVAAKSLGRKCIAIEIEEKYCEIAAKRMSQEVLNF